MAVYPPIRAAPEAQKKELYRQNLARIVDENADAILVRKNADRVALQAERALFNQEAERLAREERSADRLARQELLRKNLEVQKSQVQQIAQNNY